MAKQVEFREFTPRNSREDLIRKLEEAPEEHAEALLAAYDLLQRAHEKGLIDLANGLLSASETVVDRAVDMVSSKPAVTALRLLLMAGGVLASVDANKVQDVLESGKKAPSLFGILRQAMGEDARRGLGVVVGLMRVVGEGLRG